MNSTSPASDAVVQIAREFIPEVNAQSAAIEQARRLPQPLADKLAHAGLFRLLVPTIYGGIQAHPWAFFETLETLASGDGAVGWCAMIANTTGLLSASLESDWAETIYGTNLDVITVGVTAPIGRAEAMGDDLKVTGRWPFGSGCETAEWICGGVTIQDNGETRLNAQGLPQTVLVFFKRDEVTIHDTWDVSGLRGTGSHDIEVKDVHVPAGRWVNLGGRAKIDAPLYRFPTFGLLALGVSAVSLGIARRALDEFITLAQAKTPTGASHSLARRAMVQRDVAQATAALDSARALTQQKITAAYDTTSRGERLDLETKAGLRLAAAHNAWTAVEVVDKLYHAAGGSSIYAKNKLQQCFRDVHVPTQHIMVGQPLFEVVGKTMLGLDPKQPL